MKTFIISLLIFLSVIIFWLFISDYMHSSLHANIELIEEEIEKEIIKGNWGKAMFNFEVFIEKWKKQQTLYNLFIDQSAVMEINYSNARTKIYIENKDVTLALGELSFIKEHLRSLHENEQINLENIF